jgi:hypothetical protein
MKTAILKILISLQLCLMFFHAEAQDIWRRPLTISLFTVATQLPGGKMVPLHPGIELGTEFRYNKAEKNQWLQTVKVGVYYHQYSQTGLQLYSELNYRRKVWQKIRGDVKLGAGYLHAIPDLQTFVLKDGVYVKKNSLGRPQFMVSLSLGAGYQVFQSADSPVLFITYQSFLQMPFIKSYVPVLPNTALHLGISIPLFEVNKTK